MTTHVTILIRLLILFGVALLAAPFVLSSLYVDQRGITIPGRVSFKSETITVHYAAWKRSTEATIEYHPPDTGSVSFFEARLDPKHYDALHKGATVSLHYLRRQDIPTVPLSDILWQMHALPTVRLSWQRAFSSAETLFTRKVMIVCEAVVGLAILLLIWRYTQVRLFWWTVGVCVAVGVIVFLLQDFPRPTPPPISDVRQGWAQVKSISRIDRLFEGDRDRGFDTKQPVDVVGLEFVPAGRTEPVVGVDLIDAGSVPGLTEKSTVAIEYEGGSPRTAHIRSATRKFVSRNISGIVLQVLVYLMVLIVGYAAARSLGRLYNRLTR